MNTLPRDEPNKEESSIQDHELTDKELEYLKNDVDAVKEALESMPNIMTKKIECTKVTVKCVNKAERKLYEKEIYLPGSYRTIDEELEIIRKKYSSDEDVVLTVTNEEKGVASVAMEVDEFIKLARLVTKKGNEK